MTLMDKTPLPQPGDSVHSSAAPLGMKFVRLHKGTFFMGGGENWFRRLLGEVSKKTEITEDFEIAVHAVTQEQWQTVMGNNPSSFSRTGRHEDEVEDVADADLKLFPVEGVSWDDAGEFIEKLNKRERGTGWRYRLPTEAEWEYACRGGGTSEQECSYHFYLDKPTNDLSSTQANFRGHYPAGNARKGPSLERTTKVGSYPPNKLGLHDMHGNVFEWCAALHESAPAPVLRGGCWGSQGSECQANRRGCLPLIGYNEGIGFRLARVRDPQSAAPWGLRFVRLPKGTFYMGGGGGKAGLKTEIEQDFEIAVYTVTQEQWQTVMGNNPSWFSRNGGGKDEVKDISDADLKQFPVERISLDDAQEFIKQINEREKSSGWTYRLPTDVEWEYACRTGATSEKTCSYHFYLDRPTNDLSSKQANFDGNYPEGKAPSGLCLGRTRKVGSYAPNNLGLYDMHGNVCEWCEELCDGAPVRVLRGGCWDGQGLHCQAARRCKYASDELNHYGFRLVRVPSGKQPRPSSG